MDKGRGIVVRQIFQQFKSFIDSLGGFVGVDEFLFEVGLIAGSLGGDFSDVFVVKLDLLGVVSDGLFEHHFLGDQGFSDQFLSVGDSLLGISDFAVEVSDGFFVFGSSFVEGFGGFFEFGDVRFSEVVDFFNEVFDGSSGFDLEGGHVEEDFAPVGLFKFFNLLLGGAGSNGEDDSQGNEEFHF